MYALVLTNCNPCSAPAGIVLAPCVAFVHQATTAASESPTVVNEPSVAGAPQRQKSESELNTSLR